MNDRPSRRRLGAKQGLVLVVAVLVVPALAAVGGDRFTDVPSNHVFHDDIGWLADQGITRGCNPPDNTRFCPDDPVTRGQMAAFMRRMADGIEGGEGGSGAAARLAGSFGPSLILSEQSWATLATVSISAPSRGAILVDGGSSLFVGDPSDAGGAGLVLATVNQSCSDSAQGVGASWATANAAGTGSAAVSGVLAVSAGTNTVRLCGWATHASSFEQTQAIGSSIAAVWVPSTRANLASEDTATSVTEEMERLRQRLATSR